MLLSVTRYTVYELWDGEKLNWGECVRVDILIIFEARRWLRSELIGKCVRLRWNGIIEFRAGKKNIDTKFDFWNEWKEKQIDGEKWNRTEPTEKFGYVQRLVLCVPR